MPLSNSSVLWTTPWCNQVVAGQHIFQNVPVEAGRHYNDKTYFFQIMYAGLQEEFYIFMCVAVLFGVGRLVLTPFVIVQFLALGS